MARPPRSSDERDPERWEVLLRLYDVDGHTQDDIKTLLSADGEEIGQSTVGLAIQDARNRRPLTDGVRRHVDYYIWSSEKDSALARVVNVFSRVSSAARGAREAAKQEMRSRVVGVMAKVSAVPREVRRIRQLREARKAEVRKAFAPLYEMGILVVSDDESEEFFGDARALLETDDPIVYKDQGALLIGGAPDDYLFACGLTAAELRAGVSMRQRMGAYAVPRGTARPAMIGRRRADMVPNVRYPDQEWFFGSYANIVQKWLDMRSTTPGWVVGNELPSLPGPHDAYYYDRCLTQELEILEAGLIFEESCLGWGHDWTREIQTKTDILERLRRRRTTYASALYAGFTIAALVLVWIVVPPIVHGLVVAGLAVGSWLASTGDALASAWDTLASPVRDEWAAADYPATPTPGPIATVTAPEPVFSGSVATPVSTSGGIGAAVVKACGTWGTIIVGSAAFLFILIPVEKHEPAPLALCVMKILMVPVVLVTLVTFYIWMSSLGWGSDSAILP